MDEHDLLFSKCFLEEENIIIKKINVVIKTTHITHIIEKQPVAQRREE